jgi:hypothetical protein
VYCQVYHYVGDIKRSPKLLPRAKGLAIPSFERRQTKPEPLRQLSVARVDKSAGSSSNFVTPCVPPGVVEILSSRQFEDQIVRVLSSLEFKAEFLRRQTTHCDLERQLQSRRAVVRHKPGHFTYLTLLLPRGQCKLTISSDAGHPCATLTNKAVKAAWAVGERKASSIHPVSFRLNSHVPLCQPHVSTRCGDSTSITPQVTGSCLRVDHPPFCLNSRTCQDSRVREDLGECEMPTRFGFPAQT